MTHIQVDLTYKVILINRGDIIFPLDAFHNSKAIKLMLDKKYPIDVYYGNTQIYHLDNENIIWKSDVHLCIGGDMYHAFIRMCNKVLTLPKILKFRSSKKTKHIYLDAIGNIPVGYNITRNMYKYMKEYERKDLFKINNTETIEFMYSHDKINCKYEDAHNLLSVTFRIYITQDIVPICNKFCNRIKVYFNTDEKLTTINEIPYQFHYGMDCTIENNKILINQSNDGIKIVIKTKPNMLNEITDVKKCKKIRYTGIIII